MITKLFKKDPAPTTKGRWFALFLTLLSIAPPCVAANLTLPTVFSDHMVLQRDQNVPIWGKGEPGASIHVTFAGQTVEATVDDTGKWRAELSPMAASAKPGVLEVFSRSASGEEKLRFADVLVGEVWLCSGQSNMEWPMEKTPKASEDMPKANNPAIRLYYTPRVSLDKPAEQIDATWKVCSPETVKRFSGIAYYFGRKLNEDLGVPVGLILSAWGGSPIEPWIPPVGFTGIDSLKEVARQAENLPPLFNANGTRLVPGKEYRTKAHPTTAYNGMLAAHVPFAIRGVIWYQGEANRHDGKLYVDKFKALVNGWRKLWGYDFPFYFVQIAPYEYGREAPGILPTFWEAQSEIVRTIPKTAMAIITDVAETDNLHPPVKDIPGQRLALLAEAHTYGMPVTSSGPIFQRMEMRDRELVIFFDQAEGLSTRDSQPPDWFEIAGIDGVFHKADARIEANCVVLSSSDVSAPQSVRFAWHKTAIPNLVNSAGLPASSFRAGQGAQIGK